MLIYTLSVLIGIQRHCEHYDVKTSSAESDWVTSAAVFGIISNKT
jgi:hypothetical protein